MADYKLPLVEVHQMFSEIPVSLSQSQIPFIFGPNYKLHRYGEDDLSLSGEYIAGNTTTYILPYKDTLDPSKIDTSNEHTSVIAETAVVQVKNLGAGTANGSTLTLTNNPKVALEGRKLSITTTNGLVLVDVTAEASSGDGVAVTINDTLTNGEVSEIYLCEEVSDLEIPRKDLTDSNKQNVNWKITVTAGVPKIEMSKTVKVDTQSLEGDDFGRLVSADIYIAYRELLTSKADSIHALTSASEVATELSTIHPDNPLAQAVYNAALNAGGQTVRYMAVPSDDLAGYDAVLEAAKLTKDVYFITPVICRDDIRDDVIERVKAHVNEMSHATVKRWRVAFVSTEVPTVDPIYTAAANTDGSDFYVKVDCAADATYATLTFMSSNTSTTENPLVHLKKHVIKDDLFVTDFTHEEYGEKVPRKYEITAILSDTKFQVKADAFLVGKNGNTIIAEIYHELTKKQRAEALRNTSSQLADRRVYNVFPSEFTSNGILQSGDFAAACVAGLVSACLPQQPVTNLEIAGIDDVPLVYQTFTFDELNTIASGGTFILMQDLPFDQVYIRHQISTDYEANNLNTSELSVTKNLDSISYYFDNLLSPYIGRYNITPDLMTAIRSSILTGLTSLSSTNYGLYGPQIIAEGTEILLLEQDAVYKDHINCNLQLNIPYPFNRLILKLFV